MENGVYIALSGLTAMRRQMDIHANNIANVNTTAFKSERAMFAEYLARTTPQERISYVIDKGLVRDTTAGVISPTGNPFDFAISGKGYFVVESEDGPRYTRNGHFTINADGVLVTKNDVPVLDDKGSTIEIPMDNASISVTEDGVVSANGQAFSRLGIVTFQNEQELRKVGNGLYETDAIPEPVDEPRILQGMIENSNVKPIVEMTTMMKLVRQYQGADRLLRTQQELQRNAIRQLSSGGGGGIGIR